MTRRNHLLPQIYVNNHRLASGNKNDEVSDPQGEANSFVKEITPIIVLLRFLGVFPIQVSSTGMTRYRMFTLAMLYAVVVYLFSVPIQILVRSRVSKYFPGDTDLMLANLYSATRTVLILIIMLVSWMEISRAVNYLNSWSDFQVHIQTVTSRRLRLGLYRRALLCAVFIPVWLFLSLSILTLIGDYSLYPGGFLSYVQASYSLILRQTLAAFWYFNCKAVQASGQILVAELHQSLRTARDAVSTVVQYRALWLKLSRLSRACGSAVCYTHGFLLIYTFVVLLVCLYVALTSTERGLILMDTVAHLLQLFFVCDAAHAAKKQVNDAVREIIFKVKIMNRRKELDEELSTFLLVIEMCPPAMDLGGYVKVDRNLFISLCSLLLTYLVIMVQFTMLNSELEDICSPDKNVTEICGV